IDFLLERMEGVSTWDVDLGFIGWRGKHGEDGGVQGLLDMLDIPYVGSGVLASALAMDKHKAKMLFEQQSIPVPKGKRYRVQQDSEINEIVSHIKQNFECPFVVKPNSEGSTLG